MNCLACNKEFVQRFQRQKFCSTDCSLKWYYLPKAKELFRLSKEDKELRERIIKSKKLLVKHG